MKYIIFDHSNDGMLFVGTSLSVANILKSGLVDTGIRIMYAGHKSYNDVTREILITENQHLQILGKKVPGGVVSPIPESALNPIYLERKRLVKLRLPLIEYLANITWASSSTTKHTVWEGIENNLQFALRDCNPATNTFSDSLQEYAQINELEPINAYREILLEIDNIQSIKMRIYSFQKHFVTKINAVTTDDQSKQLLSRMQDVFFKDIFI